MTQNDTEKPSLTARQIRTIGALIEEGRITTAAKKAGVGRKTLYRWLDDPAFMEAYEAECDRLWGEIGLTLQAASMDAVRVLREIVNDPEAPKSVRVSAAKTLLPMTLQLQTFMEIEDQLRELESAHKTTSTGIK